MDRIIATQVFVTIIEQGSMSSAASRLNMSRSMVSRYLDQMEQWAGVSLLRRSTRKLSLTSSGEKVLAESYKILSLAEAIPSIGASTNNPSGKLRISCPHSFGEAVLLPFVKTFLQQFSEIDIELDVSNTLTDLIDERLDLAIRISNNLDTSVVAKKLSTVNSVICASKDYIKANGNIDTPEQLSQHNCLSYTRFDNWQFSKDQQESVVAVKGSLSVNDNFVLVKAAREHMGVTLVPTYVAQPWITAGELLPLLSEYKVKPFDVFAIYHSRKQMTPALRAFIDGLAEYLEQ